LTETLFIINPVAARGTTFKRWVETRPRLVALGIELREHLTTRTGEATEVTRQAITQGITRIVAVGGDGTLNEVVNGYLDQSGKALNPEATLGLLPSGTGSDFRRSLGFRTGADSIRALAGTRTRRVDAMRIVFTGGDGAELSRFGINVASFGLGGETVALVNKWRESLPSWIGGRARFIAAAVSALNRHRSVPITIQLDCEREVAVASNLIVVANGQYAGGGMMLAPNAKLDDGLLDVILTDRLTRFDIIKELRRIGRGGHLKNPKVSETRATDVAICAAEPLAIDIDGEMASYTPARLTILPSAIRFAVRSDRS
jgi:YegS/Rv2252/BmrU family lipid kinase